MNEQEVELLEKLKIYFSMVNEISRGLEMGSSPLNQCPPGEIEKFLSEPKKMMFNDLCSVRAIVHRKQEAYSYETTIKGDEGWGIRQGNFYKEENITFPEFLLTIEADKDAIRKEALRFKEALDYANLQRKREMALHELKKVDEEIQEHQERYGK